MLEICLSCAVPVMEEKGNFQEIDWENWDAQSILCLSECVVKRERFGNGATPKKRASVGISA